MAWPAAPFTRLSKAATEIIVRASLKAEEHPVAKLESGPEFPEAETRFGEMPHRMRLILERLRGT